MPLTSDPATSVEASHSLKQQPLLLYYIAWKMLYINIAFSKQYSAIHFCKKQKTPAMKCFCFWLKGPSWVKTVLSASLQLHILIKIIKEGHVIAKTCTIWGIVQLADVDWDLEAVIDVIKCTEHSLLMGPNFNIPNFNEKTFVLSCLKIKTFFCWFWVDFLFSLNKTVNGSSLISLPF